MVKGVRRSKDLSQVVYGVVWDVRGKLAASLLECRGFLAVVSTLQGRLLMIPKFIAGFNPIWMVQSPFDIRWPFLVLFPF